MIIWFHCWFMRLVRLAGDVFLDMHVAETFQDVGLPIESAQLQVTLHDLRTESFLPVGGFTISTAANTLPGLPYLVVLPGRCII